jgi:hypothetical protein
MNEAAIAIVKTHAISSERNHDDDDSKNYSFTGTVKSRTNHEVTDDIAEPAAAPALVITDAVVDTHSISYVDKVHADDYEVYGISVTEDRHCHNEDSLVPSLVNSSFDSSENNALSPTSRRDVATKPITHTKVIETPDESDIPPCGSTTTTDNPMVDTTIILEEKVDDGNDHSNRPMVANEIPSNHILLPNETVPMGLDVDDGLLTADIDALYAEACHQIATSNDSHQSPSEITSAPLQQQQQQKQLTHEEHSESLTESFYSCRDEASVSDNVNSDVSFHTALDNHCNSTINSVSQSGKNIDDSSSQRTITFSDFLSCRSGEEPSSHLYDMSSSRADELSEQGSSLRSFHTCRKFNQQGLISILKKGGTDNGYNTEKKFNIPLDILIKEVIESSSYIKSTKWNRRAKLCWLLFIALGTAVIVVLAVKQAHRGTNTKEKSEQGSVQNSTIATLTPAPSMSPSNNIPSPAPSMLNSDFVITFYPSVAPSIRPTTSRHRDNVFLRPTKKKKTNVKVVTTNSTKYSE